MSFASPFASFVAAPPPRAINVASRIAFASASRADTTVVSVSPPPSSRSLEILFTISARRRVATSIASARRRLTIDVSTFLGSGDWCRHARASLLRRDRAFRARGTSRNDEERRVVMRFATATRGSIENAPARGSIGGAMMR